MRNIIALILLSLLPCGAFAKSEHDSVAVYGNVVDNFTHEILKGIRVEIMRADSSLITEFNANDIYRSYGYPHNIDRASYLYVPRNSCIFRFSKEGYITQYVNLSKNNIKRREQRIFIGEILLKKDSKARERLLGEATVKASKVRMVVKSDTIIYNADAFQLAEGSMLDGLIKLLPGFELSNGQIRVNGEYVSSLLINGDDFFKGDPRVALENLPAYMVNKVKVYRKEHEYSYITKEKSKDELPLVVDVNLKREYAIGWVANASAGYGLENRYIARLFALRFTDNSRLAIYSNANNTNDTHEPGVSGDWSAQGVASGRTEMQTGGFEALVKDKKGVWKYTGNAKAFHQETDDKSLTSTETFQPRLKNSTFSRLQSESIGRNFKAQTSHEYNYKKPGGYMTLYGEASYRQQRNNADILGAEFTSDPKDSYRAASLDSIFFYSSDRLVAMLINKQRNRLKEKINVWNGNAKMSGFIKIPHTPDYVNISAYFNVEKQENKSFSDYSLQYGSLPSSESNTDDKRQRYAASPVLSVNGNFMVSYHYRPDWSYITPYYEITENYRDADRSFYRLDKLGDEAPAFGELPSTTAALMGCLDSQNTYTSQMNTIKSKLGVDWSIWIQGKLPSHRIQIKPELEWRTDRLTYNRDLLHSKTNRSKAAFRSTASWGFENCYIKYEMNYSYPDLISLLDYTDNADPLNLYKGNPNLNRSTSHSISFIRSLKNKKKSWGEGWTANINASWATTQNAIAHAMTYDAATGVRTYSPRNVDGNWGANFSTDYKQPFGKKHQTILSSITDINYRNSVDYVTERSCVRNLNVSEVLRMNTRIKKCILDLSVGAKYIHAASQQDNFSNINSFDLKYGVSAQLPLPVGFALSTDITIYHRMGYSDESMNDCRFVTNARLSKTLLNGRLGFTLDAFDIFHGLSNVTQMVNAQGLTETWRNSLPSYAMLQVAYKLSRKPQKR